MAPGDAWFNEHFPPYSWRRLFFLLACAPVIAIAGGVLYGPMRGDPFSWSRALVTTLGVWTMLPLLWIHIRAKSDAGELDEPRRSPRPPIPPILAQPRKQMPSNDFLYAFLISFVGFAFTSVVMNDGMTFWSLGVSAASALAFCLVLRFRHSPLTLVAISAVVALPAAILMKMFFFFLNDGTPLWMYWMFSAVMAFVFLLPFWWNIRRFRDHPIAGTVPMWIFSAGATIMLVLSVLSVGSFDDTASAGSDSPAVSAAPNDLVGAATEEEAALRLYYAWKNLDRETAGEIAVASVVDDLFAMPFDPSAHPLGCNVVIDGQPHCAIRTNGELLVMTMHVAQSQRAFVAELKLMPSTQRYTIEAR